MSSRREKLRRQKRILVAIRAVICVLCLVIVVLLISLLTKAFRHKPNQDEPVNNITDTKDPNETDNKDDNTNTPDEPEPHVLTVCIDPGHGGKDGGANSGSRLEKDDVLKLAQKVASLLEEQNIKVIMTRDDDSYPTLSERCNIANNAKADYLVSIHRNKGNGYGVETWISVKATQEDKDLANNIMAGLKEVGIQRDRGVKTGSQSDSKEDLAVNGSSNMPSCLIELGFMNNSKDNQLFDSHLSDYAKAIANAIVDTYKTHHPDGVISADKSDQTTTPTDNPGQSTPGSTSQTGTSHTMNNTQIDISSLSTKSEGWGPGSDCDDKNRPNSALSYQNKYGKYNANFIVPDSNKVYLTFDEGYENGCTPAILDTLKAKNVKAVFFVTSQFAKQNPTLVQRIIDEGHMLGNHSVTHPSKGLPSQSVEKQQNEVMELHNYIKENYNYEMHLFRYPAGIFSEQSLAIVNNCNYKSVFWSFAYLDYDTANQPDPAKALEKVKSRLHPGAIYLLHAVSTTNTEILGDFIDYIRAQGYEIGLFD